MRSELRLREDQCRVHHVKHGHAANHLTAMSSRTLLAGMLRGYCNGHQYCSSSNTQWISIDFSLCSIFLQQVSVATATASVCVNQIKWIREITLQSHDPYVSPVWSTWCETAT